MMFMKKNGGFTLVELIVVIAILAILAGVAVPAYSGYVEKANKQADISLAREVENALVLAHYSGTLEKGASVTVYYGDSNVAANGNGADAAMKAVFGDDYATNLRLTYGGWDAGPAGDASVMQNVQNSNFKREEMDSLLTQVQTVVDAFSNYMVGYDIDTNSPNYKYLQAAGYTGGKITEENAQAVGNAAVFGVSEQFSGLLGNAESKQAFVDAWATGNFTGVQGLDGLSQTAAKYAYTLAMAKHADSLAGGTTYSDMLIKGVNAEGADNKALINGNMAAVIAAIEANEDTTFNDGMYKYYNGDGTGNAQIQTDANAFLAYMEGVTSTSGSILESNDLGKQNFFNDGNVLNYVDNYFDASAYLQNASGGAMVFIYNGSENIFCAPDWAYK